MRRVYRTLLRLYPREYRRQFGDEMLAVFTRAAAERRVEGRISYVGFLAVEFVGLLESAWAELPRRMSVAPMLAGIAVAGILYSVFIAGALKVAHAAATVVCRFDLYSSDPLAGAVALCFFGMASLLSLLPIVILMSTRLARRRR